MSGEALAPSMTYLMRPSDMRSVTWQGAAGALSPLVQITIPPSLHLEEQTSGMTSLPEAARTVYEYAAERRYLSMLHLSFGGSPEP